MPTNIEKNIYENQLKKEKNQVKIYKIKVTHTKRGTKKVEGTLLELIRYFGYTLEVGYSYNKKIQKQPKTIKSFIKNLQASFEEKEGGYEKTFIDLDN